MTMNKPNEHDERALPEGWAWASIDEITQAIAKIQPTPDPDAEFVYLDISAVDNSRNVISTPKTYRYRDAPSRAQQIVNANDVLFSTVRTYLKNIALVPDRFDRQIASTGFSVLRANSATIPRYLFYLCLESEFLAAIELLQRGTSYPAIRDSDLRAQFAPLAPLAEQHRIVEAIETQFSRLDAGIEALKRVQANLKRYKAAVLKAACEGKLVPQDPNDEPASEMLKSILAERRAKWEADQRAKGKNPAKLKYPEPAAPDTDGLPELPQGWVWATVEQIGIVGEQTVLTGPFGSSLGRSDFLLSGVPVLTIGCLQERGIELDKAEYVSEEKAIELGRYRLRTGDLLFSRMASVGRAGLVTSELDGTLMNYHIMRLRLSKQIIDPEFFITYVRASRVVSDYLIYVNHGATRDGINTAQLQSMPVPIPPLMEQQRMMYEVENFQSLIDAIDDLVFHNLKRSERLRQSILRDAFRGRLVPQDPNDEPAFELLARIREKRAAQTQTKKSKKR